MKKHLPTTTNSNNEPTRGQKLLSSSNLCSDAYKSLIKEISSTPTKSQEKWISDCNIDEKSINWNHSYILPFRCTRETRLRTFQFKLLHRRIATNRYLNRIGISLTDTCTFCEQNSETLIHLFWDCTHTHTFWQNFKSWLFQCQVKPNTFVLSLPMCLGLVDNMEDVLLHHALLTARFHIYLSKIKKNLPNIEIFSKIFLKCEEIERLYAFKTDTVQKFNSKWRLFK